MNEQEEHVKLNLTNKGITLNTFYNLFQCLQSIVYTAVSLFHLYSW